MDDCNNNKQCSRCQVTKPFTDFYIQKASRDGRSPWCKLCSREYQRARYNDPEVRERIREHIRQYHADYYANPEIKDKRKRYLKEWRNDNREKDSERKRQYLKTEHGKAVQKSQNHRRRARIRNAEGTLTAADIALVRKGQTNPKTGKVHCWHCNKPITGEEHVDHFIPISKGGRNDAGNIRISCAECNCSKGAKLPSEYNGRLI